MLSIVVSALVVILNFILQSTLIQLIEIRGIVPEIMIIVVVSYALLRGQFAGAMTGFFGGLLYDVIFGDAIGFHALMYMLIGYFCGISHKSFYRENFILPITFSVIANFITGALIYVTSFLLRNNYDVIYFLFNVIIPQCVYTGVVAIVVYRILYSINNKVEKKEREKRKLF